MSDHLLVAEVIPEFAAELECLLQTAGEEALAKQVSVLRIVERCQCGDDFCASMYTVPKPKGAWGPSHRNIAPAARYGMIVLDVVDDKIAMIEVLGRSEIREKLNSVIPLVNRT
jgi:hypothetical protein